MTKLSANVGNKDTAILERLLDRSLEDRIRERAHELYVQRGRQDGREEADWCKAEEELLANR